MFFLSCQFPSLINKTWKLLNLESWFLTSVVQNRAETSDRIARSPQKHEFRKNRNFILFRVWSRSGFHRGSREAPAAATFRIGRSRLCLRDESHQIWAQIPKNCEKRLWRATYTIWKEIKLNCCTILGSKLLKCSLKVFILFEYSQIAKPCSNWTSSLPSSPSSTIYTGRQQRKRICWVQIQNSWREV